MRYLLLSTDLLSGLHMFIFNNYDCFFTTFDPLDIILNQSFVLFTMTESTNYCIIQRIIRGSNNYFWTQSFYLVLEDKHLPRFKKFNFIFKISGSRNICSFCGLWEGIYGNRLIKLNLAFCCNFVRYVISVNKTSATNNLQLI